MVDGRMGFVAGITTSLGGDLGNGFLQGGEDLGTRIFVRDPLGETWAIVFCRG